MYRYKGTPGLIIAYLRKMRNDWLTLLLVDLVLLNAFSLIPEDQADISLAVLRYS